MSKKDTGQVHRVHGPMVRRHGHRALPGREHALHPGGMAYW
jgi:hypothetical protein